MKQMIIDSQDTKEFFIRAFNKNNLVPILGSGFSAGMPTKHKKKIPSGTELKEYMIKVIYEHRKDFAKVDLSTQNFSWISEQFFKCNMEAIVDYFYKNFTGVEFIGINKNKFLNEIAWPYIYTLNIDTAIESSDNNWEVFYPNNDFLDYTVLNKKKLYKIHGDINHFCKTKNIDDLIFSESQYMKSLYTNSQFHNMLATDCNGKNLIYIGCSLDDEIDIKYSVISDSNKNNAPIKARRIYVTSSDIESDPIKMENLKRFQITHYIKLENTNDYELFYEFMVNCYNESLKESKMPIEHYEITKIKTLENDRELNIQYLINLLPKIDYTKPSYFIQKDNFDFNSLDTQKINIFTGRRFSGKTLFAYNIIEYFEDRKKYFISSNETIADNNLISLISEHNSLIIFDTNSITEDQLTTICNKYNDKKNKTNIICIFINNFDDIINIIPYLNQVKIHELNFKGYLTDEENKDINSKLSKLGILKFNNRLTILDNTLRIANKLHENYLNTYAIESKKELILLIWLAVNKKIYL